MTEHVYSYLCTTIHNGVSSDSGGVDNIVSIFEVQHLGKHCPSISMLCLSTNAWCSNTVRVHLSLSSCSPALSQPGMRSAHWVRQLDLWCLLQKCEQNSLWFHVVWSNLSVSCSYNWTLNRSGVKPSWISMALIPTLFLPGVVQPVSVVGLKMPCAIMVSKSAVLNPKHTLTLTSPMLMSVFLLWAVRILRRKKKAT